MTIIPLSFNITRDAETGKKLYSGQKKPTLPKGWQTQNQSPGLNLEDPPASYALRLDTDTIVIDCDDMDSTTDIGQLMTVDTYIVVNDKGFKHFYFRPNKYFMESVLAIQPNRVAVGKIDILKGNSLVFTACEGNETKTVYSGTMADITPIPEAITDYLTKKLKVHIVEYTGDYVPTLNYMAPQIEQAIQLYINTKDYRRSLQGVMEIVTPNKYKHMTLPDYHPDRVPDGQGADYIQALSSKIAGDPSISEDLHKQFIELITMHLWLDPFTTEQFNGSMSNLRTQVYPSGEPIFKYNPEPITDVMISINNLGFTRLYRTDDDRYIIPKPAGTVNIIKGYTNLKRALISSNYSLMFDNKQVPPQLVGKMLQELLHHVPTVKLVDHNYGPSGMHVTEDGDTQYNIYTPTQYLAIVRNKHLQHKVCLTVPPMIQRLLDSVTGDHPSKAKLQRLMHEFLSHKLKTLDHSPIIWHFIGNRGTGKDVLVDLMLEPITRSVGKINLMASNSQFNIDYITTMFVKSPEIVITPKVVNDLKDLSGSKTVKSEAKGETATRVRNTATYIASANSTTLLAETTDDRRFVTISSFTSPELVVRDLDTKLALELEDYCLYLRDIKILTPQAYTSAKPWHDEVTLERFEDATDARQDVGSKLAVLAGKISSIPPDEIASYIKDTVDHWYVTKKCDIHIPISFNGMTVVKSGADANNYTSKGECMRLGLAVHIKRNKNVGGRYSKAYQYLKLKLTTDQLKALTVTEEISEISEYSPDLS